jgi:hypothetical protein
VTTSDAIRLAVAAVAVAAALALPTDPQNVPRPAPETSIPAPSAALADKARPVAASLADATDAERATWAEVWSKVAATVAAEGKTDEAIFGTSRATRSYLVAALEIGWRRIGGVEHGRFPDLKRTVEAYLADPAVLGKDDAAMSDADRQRFIDAANALAFVALRRG